MLHPAFVLVAAPAFATGVTAGIAASRAASGPIKFGTLLDLVLACAVLVTAPQVAMYGMETGYLSPLGGIGYWLGTVLGFVVGGVLGMISARLDEPAASQTSR